MSERQMKGITVCADCVYYSLKRHKCNRGCTDEGKPTDHFYADCPLPDVEPVRHAHWKKISPAGIYECSNCKQDVMTSDICVYNYCHMCGARMDEAIE